MIPSNSLSTRETPSPRVGSPEGRPTLAPSGNHSNSADGSPPTDQSDTPGRGASSPGTQHQRLNFKFSVADTDRIVLMARQHMTCLQISTWFKLNRLRAVAPTDIAAVCKEAGVRVKWGKP